ncbi:MAG: hypothetical protein KG075_00345 [Alphaproteobacteria bacterium]|nr:hypothetical protein [Alphaproteobacteria bacterium]
MIKKFSSAVLLGGMLLGAVPLVGCMNANEFAKKIGQPPQGAVEMRSLQTRRFESLDEHALLSAAQQTLQDLGFTISEASADAGVLAGSKQRDATESGQIAGQVALTVVMALLGSAHTPTWDKEQTINVTLTATPIQNSKQTEIRVSFDRHMLNNHGHLWRAELLMDEKIYQEFFDKFAQGAFLEAQKI